MPDLSNAILFFEGYKTNIIHWNTLLEQYNQIGVLKNAVVFGYIYKLQFEDNNKYNIESELMKIKKDIPIVKTNEFGHEHPNSIIPIGTDIEINLDYKSINIISKYLN